MPGNLVSATLRGGLFARVVGKRLLYFQEIGSTMDEAAREAEAGADEGTVVVAESQTVGRAGWDEAGCPAKATCTFPSCSGRQCRPSRC